MEFLITRTSQRNCTKKRDDREPQKPFNTEYGEKINQELYMKEFEGKKMWSNYTYQGWFIEIEESELWDFIDSLEISDVIVTRNRHNKQVKEIEVYDDYRE